MIIQVKLYKHRSKVLRYFPDMLVLQDQVCTGMHTPEFARCCMGLGVCNALGDDQCQIVSNRLFPSFKANFVSHVICQNLTPSYLQT